MVWAHMQERAPGGGVEKARWERRSLKKGTAAGSEIRIANMSGYTLNGSKKKEERGGKTIEACIRRSLRHDCVGEGVQRDIGGGKRGTSEGTKIGIEQGNGKS